MDVTSRRKGASLYKVQATVKVQATQNLGDMQNQRGRNYRACDLVSFPRHWRLSGDVIPQNIEMK
jgi:hypothetical protein